ncbi:MAG: class I SAM-dependent methyltransferase, partial [Candidatus Binataceae bacterium]
SLSLHPDADRICAMMRAGGFSEATYRLTGFGTVAIHLAHKDSKDSAAGRLTKSAV